jgi:hypothetical protein
MISVEPQPTMEVNIHNQCSDFELLYPMYFNSGANKCKHCRRTDSVNTRNVDLVPFLSTFRGATTYILKSRYFKPSNQYDSTHIRLLVAWKSEGYKKFYVFMHILECNNWVKWDEIKLDEYCQRYARQLCTYTGPIEDTLLTPDGTILITRLELDFTQRDGVLNITISEGVKDDHTRRPEWFNSKM